MTKKTHEYGTSSAENWNWFWASVEVYTHHGWERKQYKVSYILVTVGIPVSGTVLPIKLIWLRWQRSDDNDYGGANIIVNINTSNYF